MKYNQYRYNHLLPNGEFLLCSIGLEPSNT